MDLRRWMLASFVWLTPGGAEAGLDFFAQFSMSTFCGAGSTVTDSGGNAVPCPPGSLVEKIDERNQPLGPLVHAIGETFTRSQVGLSGTTAIETLADGDLGYGTLKAHSRGRVEDDGAYFAAGGDSFSGHASVEMNLAWSDVLTLSGPPGPLSYTFGQSVTQVSGASLDKPPPADPCKANARASTQLQALTSANAATSGSSASLSYVVSHDPCLGSTTSGSPASSATIVGQDGEQVTVGAYVLLHVDANIFGLTSPTFPESVHEALAEIDASHTSQFSIVPVTPGASYTSQSGTVYSTVPEADAELLAAAGAAALFALGRGTRLRV